MVPAPLEDSLASLQSLILAQLCCIQTGDSTLLQQYKALATNTAQRLGLHQSQKTFPLDALTCELRKRAFWTLYTIDAYVSLSAISEILTYSAIAFLRHLWGFRGSPWRKVLRVNIQLILRTNSYLSTAFIPLSLGSSRRRRAQ